jgi:hypothetical protein
MSIWNHEYKIPDRLKINGYICMITDMVTYNFRILGNASTDF